MREICRLEIDEAYERVTNMEMSLSAGTISAREMRERSDDRVIDLNARHWAEYCACDLSQMPAACMLTDLSRWAHASNAQRAYRRLVKILLSAHVNINVDDLRLSHSCFEECASDQGKHRNLRNRDRSLSV